MAIKEEEDRIMILRESIDEVLGKLEKNFLGHRPRVGGGNFYSKPGIKPLQVMCFDIVLPWLLTLSLPASFFLLPEFLGAVGVD